MKKFLEKVAEVILKKSQEELLTTAVIFPNKRSEVFLKDHLKQQAQENTWLPEMYSIDEFIVNASGMHDIDPVQSYFELFEIHKNIAGADARPIEDFLSWAPMMMADFNDIDMYLADAEKIFSHLSEIKAMEEWNLDRKPLTKMQVNYLAFYNALINYYQQLKSSLKQKNAGYKGMIFRHLAENITDLSKPWPWKQFIVVGFNALTEAEQRVFDYLHENYQTDFLWDIDEYYFTTEGRMEAGRFIVKMLDRWPSKNINWVGNGLLTGKKEITVLGIPKRIGQVKFAGQELENIFIQQTQLLQNQALNTAVVLADESLLTPLLNSLPTLSTPEGKSVGYNITMGYPVSNTPFSQFLKEWLELLVMQSEQSRQFYSTRHFVALLNNPVISILINDPANKSSSAYLQNLRSKSAAFLSKDELLPEATANTDEPWILMLNLVLYSNAQPADFIKSLISLLQLFKAAIENLNQHYFLLKEQLLLTMTVAKRLSQLIEANAEAISLKALLKIVVQLLRRSEINLKGEPLSGIQIMGMLETRNLDFKNLIILSANEGILPKTDSLESFIPFDLRSQFKLPLPKDKTDIFAYHFFRLLQRAENITLVYNSQADALGGGEKSRFILQLQEELAKVNQDIVITEKQLSLPAPGIQADNIISIHKDEEVRTLIQSKIENGLSPTALSTFINCPLQFYFSQLLKLRTPEVFEQNIESDVFGNVVHGVLEQLFKPFLGKEIEAELLKKSMATIDTLLIDQFAVNYAGGDLKSGKNLLIVEVAKKYIERFVKSDVKTLSTQKSELLAVEEMLTSNLFSGSTAVKIKGKIDRIDRLSTNNIIRLIDYKTGGVEPGDLKLDDWESLINDPKYAKVFQLLFYVYLFKNSVENSAEIEAGIISLRKPSGGYLQPTLPEKEKLLTSMDLFEEQLLKLIENLLDTSLPFAQTDDDKNCNWCDFKGICNRAGTPGF